MARALGLANHPEAISVDSSNNNVGIGTSSPASTLDVDGEIRSVGVNLAQGNAGVVDARFAFNQDGTQVGWIGAPQWDSDGLYIYGPTASSSTEPVLKYSASQLELRTSNTNRLVIDSSGKVSISSGAVELNSSVVNGIAVLIADNAYATITPTGRYGGNLSITAGANGAFPNHRVSWFGYADFGNSPFVQAINYGTPRSGASTDAGSLFDVSTNGQPSGTTGTDGNVTLYVGGTSGTFYLENRSGAQIQFQITLI